MMRDSSNCGGQVVTYLSLFYLCVNNNQKIIAHFLWNVRVFLYQYCMLVSILHERLLRSCAKMCVFKASLCCVRDKASCPTYKETILSQFITIFLIFFLLGFDFLLLHLLSPSLVVPCSIVLPTQHPKNGGKQVLYDFIWKGAYW